MNSDSRMCVDLQVLNLPIIPTLKILEAPKSRINIVRTAFAGKYMPPL